MMSETIARSSSVITSFSMIEATMMISSKVRSSLAVSSIVFDLKLSRRVFMKLSVLKVDASRKNVSGKRYPSSDSGRNVYSEKSHVSVHAVNSPVSINPSSVRASSMLAIVQPSMIVKTISPAPWFVRISMISTPVIEGLRLNLPAWIDSLRFSPSR